MRSASDFFVSYTAADEAWARWMTAELERAGFDIVLQANNFPPGSDFVHSMQRAISTAERTIAVLSPMYFDSQFGEAEWRAAFVKDPTGELGLLLPVRVQKCTLPGLLASRSYIDLVGRDGPAARRALLDGVGAPTRSSVRATRQTASLDAETVPPYPGDACGPDSSRAETAERSSGLGPQLPEEADGEYRPIPEEGSWAGLSRTRPTFAELLGGKAALVGHAALQRALQARLDDPESAALVLLSGPSGSGKSSVVRWLHQFAGERVVDAGTARSQLGSPLREDGSDVRRLLREVDRALAVAGRRAVLVYDDADHELREEGIIRLVREAIARLDLAFVVICTSTPLTPELFPLPATSLTLDRRRADRQEFDGLLNQLLYAAGEHPDAFSADLRQSLHDMAEQTVDFRAVEYVIELLLAYHQWTGRVARPAVLRRLLEADPVRQLHLPAVLVRDSRLSFRRRDKSELLAMMLLRHLPTPRALANVAQRSLEDFDLPAFLHDAEQPTERAYWDGVMGLCLTYSPRDLVLDLLTPAQIRHEIDLLGLDPARLVMNLEEQVQRLVRSLGFTLIGAPTGLTALKDAVQQARAVVGDAGSRTDVLRSAASKVIGHADGAIRDLLHFWGTYLFGSVRTLVKEYNAAYPPDAAVDVKHPTSQGVVRLLRFVNEAAEAEGSAYRLFFPEGGSPVSADLLKDYMRFDAARQAFERAASAVAPTSAAPMGLRNRCGGLVESADGVLARAGESSHPTVIKLTEIIFDEYSRKIFRGVDSDNKEIRFALTDNEEREDLVVAAHYFMLPPRHVSVNPHIVPLAGSSSGVLFDRASDYEEASTTQRRQGRRLLELVELWPDDVVIEVGSGTGALAIEVANRVQRVLGIDQSPDMVRQALLNAQAAGVSNISFEVADLLEHDSQPWFDLVLSSSSMHWILPEDRAYQQLFSMLRRGGRLGVHQGGSGTYRGLHQLAVTLVRELGYDEHFRGWRFPAFYPSPEEYRNLLEGVGFVNVEVTSEVSDGSDAPNLVTDFSEAGLLPYLYRLPEMQRESFQAEFVAESERYTPDLYTHRLYVVARRP